jgi:hypothetical protein
MSAEGRPRSLAIVDSYFAAARIAHEYAFDLHRELAELDAADGHTRELLHESAVVALERMPELTRRLRNTGREWAEQELLDPSAAERTIKRLDEELADLAPSLAALRARQNQIVAELRNRITRSS